MAKLQRVVIRDDLIEDAKRIQKRYALRSWGDAINFVFAAHRDEYLTTKSVAAPLPTTMSVLPVESTVSVTNSFTDPLASANPFTEAEQPEQPDLRNYLANLDYSMDEAEVSE